MPMTETSREEHLKWCKRRALEYVERDDCSQAVASMLSDLRKHPETENHSAIELMAQLLFAGLLDSTVECRSFIEGFN